jgi:hypothetical protein
MSKRIVTVVLIALVLEATAYGGLGSKKTKYLGGTIADLKG